MSCILWAFTAHSLILPTSSLCGHHSHWTQKPLFPQNPECSALNARVHLKAPSPIPFPLPSLLFSGYYASVSVGGSSLSGVQRFSVGLDTSSSLFVLPCTGCTNCSRRSQVVADNGTQVSSLVKRGHRGEGRRERGGGRGEEGEGAWNRSIGTEGLWATVCGSCRQCGSHAGWQDGRQGSGLVNRLAGWQGGRRACRVQARGTKLAPCRCDLTQWHWRMSAAGWVMTRDR